MGKHDGKVTIGTELDKSGIKKGLGTLGADMGGYAKGIGKVSGALGGLGGVLRKLGGLLTTIFSVTAIINFGKESVQLGSDLQEVQNVVDVTFSTMNEQVNNFAKNAMHTAGLSETMAKQYTGTFGAMANSFKFAEKDAFAMATTLTQLTGDVASFYNITQDEAYTKLSAVFTGETEALKHLGVVMTETALNEFAMQQGIEKTVQKMTEQEKVALRYKFVLEQLSDASGDFARTSGSWANQTRLLKVQFDQLKATIGQGLINALTPVLRVINTVIAKLQTLANMFRSITAALFGDAAKGAAGATGNVDKLGDSYSDAADDAEGLADKTKEAGNAAKRYLAGFDEIKRLGAPESGADGGSAGGGGDTGGMDFDIGLDDATSGVDQAVLEIEAFVNKIKELMQPLLEIDFNPLKESLLSFGESVKKVGEMITGALEWVWFNILVPLASWVIEDAAPATLKTFAEAIDAVRLAAIPAGEGLQKMWDEMKPMVEFIGDTAISLIEALGEIYSSLAQVMEEKGDKITETLENLGTVFSALYTVAEPVLTFLRETLIKLLTEGTILGLTAQLSGFIDALHGVTQMLAGLLSGDTQMALSGFTSLISSEFTRAGENINAFAALLGIDTEAIRLKLSETCTNIQNFFIAMWLQIQETWSPVATWFNDNVIIPLQEFFAPIVTWFGDLFGEIEKNFSDVCYNINTLAEGCWLGIEAVWSLVTNWIDTNVIKPVKKRYEDMWNSVSNWATETWNEIKRTYQTVRDWFDRTVVQPVKQKFTGLWNGIAEKASAAWTRVQQIFSGVSGFFKGVINGAIRILNSGISRMYSGINSMIRGLRELEIAGIAPFSGLRTLSPPQIPYLAKGAVLPPNKPFLAMVGDQRHGTNIEAPLATIQEAVALVMQDMIASNMAGHEATVAVLREILEAVLGIQIGDDVIAAAVDRQRSKMAIVRGGAL